MTDSFWTQPHNPRRGGGRPAGGGRGDFRRSGPPRQNATVAAPQSPAQDISLEPLITYVAQALVNHPDDVAVTISVDSGVTVYQLQVNPTDTGKVIGRQGRVANALRTVLKAASATGTQRAMLEIV